MELIDSNDLRITYYESDDEWKADRKGCGATTAYKLLEMCPASWGGPWSVWASHHYDGWEDTKSTAVMSAGLTWEPYVLQWYDRTRIDGNDDSDRLFLDVQTCRIEAAIPGVPLRPSPDALIWDDDRIIGGVEVKCPRFGWDDYAGDGVMIEQWETQTVGEGWLGRPRYEYPCPLQYVVQVYLTMAALRSVGHNVDYWDLVVCFGPHDTRVITFLWDADMAHKLVDMLRDKWDDIVVQGNEPMPDESRQAWEYLLGKPRPKGPVRLDPQVDKRVADDVLAYVAGHQQDSQWQKDKRSLRVCILDEARGRGTEALEVEKDGWIHRVKVTGTGRFYAKKIQTK